RCEKRVEPALFLGHHYGMKPGRAPGVDRRQEGEALAPLEEQLPPPSGDIGGLTGEVDPTKHRAPEPRELRCQGPPGAMARIVWMFSSISSRHRTPSMDHSALWPRSRKSSRTPPLRPSF